MAQTRFTFDKPTKVYSKSGQTITLQAGTHFLSSDWSTSAPTPAPTPAPAPAPTYTPTPAPTPTPAQPQTQDVQRLFSKYGYTATPADVSYWQISSKTNQWGNLEQNLIRRKQRETPTPTSTAPIISAPAPAPAPTPTIPTPATTFYDIDIQESATGSNVFWQMKSDGSKIWSRYGRPSAGYTYFNSKEEALAAAQKLRPAIQTQDVEGLFAKYGYTPTPADISYWQDPNKTNEWGNLEQNLQRRKEKETPAPTIPETISTDILEKEDEGIIEESKINQDYLDKVKITYDKYGGQAGANESFVVGAARAAGIDPDMGLIGKTLNVVLETYKLKDKIEGFGIEEDKITWKAGLTDDQKDKIRNLIERKPRVEWNRDDIANYNFATGSNEKVIPPEDIIPEAPTPEVPIIEEPVPSFEEQVGTAKDQEKRKIGDATSNLYDELISEKIAGLAEGIDIDEYKTKANEATMAVETARQSIADKKMIDAVILEGIAKDKPISLVHVQRQQDKYTRDEYITNLKMAQDYNNKLILSEMARGNFLEAQNINKSIADDIYEINKMQLDSLKYNDKIKIEEYNRLDKENDYERAMANEGFIYLPNADAYNNAIEKYQITPSNFDNFILKDPVSGRMYLRPLEEAGKGNLQYIKGTADQPAGVFNPATGEFTQLDPTDTTGKGIGALSEYDVNILIARLGKQIYGTRISDKEGERVENFIREGMKMNKTEYEIIDDVIGFKITKNKELAENLRNILLQYTTDEGLSGYDMLGLARLINSDNKIGAINKVEKEILSQAEDGISREGAAVYAIAKGNEVINDIEGLTGKLGIFYGNWNKLKTKFLEDKEFIKIKGGMTALITEWRLKMAGSNVTENEIKFLESLIADVTDNPFNAMQKIREFQAMNLQQTNAIRVNYNLPELNENTLLDKNARVKMYETKAGISPVKSIIKEGIENQYSSFEIINFLGNNDYATTDILDALYTQNDKAKKMIDDMKEYYNESELIQYLQNQAKYGNLDFNNVGGDTNEASEISQVIERYKGDKTLFTNSNIGEKFGQCGKFVNKITRLGLGDSYSNKMAKMDTSIKTPQVGDVFLMPYKKTGHVGMILSIKNGIATVKDSNYNLDEKILIHDINVNKMTAFARV